jgi:uncharacterized protein YndB with AHSA1/START domain
MTRATSSVSATRVIPADAQQLFDLVADPSMHAVFDGSSSVRGVRGGSRKLGLGDRFTTKMRIGVPYLIQNKVVEYEEGRRIAWSHLGGWRWRYEFEPVEDGTKVTETFDWSTARSRRYVEMMGWPERNRRNLERTLERLAAYVANTSAST